MASKKRTEVKTTVLRGPIAAYAKTHNLPTYESLQPLTLIVESGDVKGARKLSPTSCGFAKACKRQVPGVKSVHFFRTTAWLEYADKLVRYNLPDSMHQEILAFDRTGDMRPGKYMMKAVTPANRLTAMRAQKEKLRSGRRAGLVLSSPKPRSIRQGLRTTRDPACSVAR